MLVNTDIRLFLNIFDRVCSRGRIFNGYRDSHKVLVQVVIGENHAIFDGRFRIRPIDIAVEKVLLGCAKGCLDIVIELRNDIVNLVKVGVVVYKRKGYLVSYRGRSEGKERNLSYP